MMDEIWAPAIIDTNIIMVSNMGRVQNSQRKTFGGTTSCRYKSVTFNKIKYFVHRLVVIAFRGHFDPLLPVNHIDRDRINNKLKNLEVVTHSENTLHSIRLGNNTTKSIQQLDLNVNIIATYPSMREASDATKIKRTNIGNAADGRRQKTAGGFIWRFI